jgi:hypothetical protein
MYLNLRAIEFLMSPSVVYFSQFFLSLALTLSLSLISLPHFISHPLFFRHHLLVLVSATVAAAAAASTGAAAAGGNDGGGDHWIGEARIIFIWGRRQLVLEERQGAVLRPSPIVS